MTERAPPPKGSWIPAFFAVIALGIATLAGWDAAGRGLGLSSDLDDVSLRDESAPRARGGRVFVGGGLRGGK